MMKKITLLAISILFASCIMAQSLKEKEVPAAVIEAFKTDHNDIKKAHWEKYRGKYQVTYTIEKKDHVMLFDKTGKLVSYNKQVDKSELPSECETYINEKFEKPKIVDVINMNINDSIVYSVAMRCKKGDYELFFDKDGKFLKKKSQN